MQRVRAPSALSKHTQARSVTQKASDWAEHRCHLFWVWFQCRAAGRGCFSVSAESIVGEKAEGNLNYHSFSLTHTFVFFLHLLAKSPWLQPGRGWFLATPAPGDSKSNGKVNLSCRLCWLIYPFWFFPSLSNSMLWWKVNWLMLCKFVMSSGV